MKLPELSKFKWLLPVSLMLVLAACNQSGQNSGDTSEIEPTTDQSQNENIDLEKAKSIFFMLPSPIETAALMRKAGAVYNGEVLHNHKDAAKYLAIKDKAVNLGIYGADLSYSSIFERSQECIYYIGACRKLAESIGVGEAFNSALIERMNNNINDKDSVFQIVSEAYWLVNSKLKENDRASVSALIIAGGWVEGLYIGVQTLKENPNDEIKQRIAEQKYSLNDLVELVDSYGSNDALSEMRTDLNQLKGVFDEMDIIQEENETSLNEDGSTTIGGSRDIQISEEQLDRISEIAISIRNKYVKA